MTQAGIGILLLALGVLLIFATSQRYSEKRYIVDAAACRMTVLAIQRADLPATSEAGSVVLLHGISANNVIMQYLARSFAELGLRVYIPDLPGHGRSPGPFSPELAESCSAALLRGLAARGMIVPERTILAGHSMGGAIALRIAGKFRPAGVIAISPAPMQAAHGVTPENLLFHDVPGILPNTRIVVGQFEPPGLVNNAADLAASAHDPSVIFSVMPWRTHVSMLFSPAVAIAAQAWAARVLSLSETTTLPSHANLVACVLGLLGILLVAGPFIRDVVGKKPRAETSSGPAVPWWRGLFEVLFISLLIVFVLRYWEPLRFIHLFEGDYLASFFLLVGLALLAIHFRDAYVQIRAPISLLLGSALAALLLHFLVTSWFELTATSAWLTLQRWARFPVFFVAAFCFLYALELLAGPAAVEPPRLRYFVWSALAVVAWLPMTLAVFHLRSGEILLVLLSAYFALQFLLAGLGIQLVRRLTGSATAAAVFGAILLAGFCLVLFPVS